MQKGKKAENRETIEVFVSFFLTNCTKIISKLDLWQIFEVVLIIKKQLVLEKK